MRPVGLTDSVDQEACISGIETPIEDQSRYVEWPTAGAQGIPSLSDAVMWNFPLRVLRARAARGHQLRYRPALAAKAAQGQTLSGFFEERVGGPARPRDPKPSGDIRLDPA
jgi:hypothetical protein